MEPGDYVLLVGRSTGSPIPNNSMLQIYFPKSHFNLDLATLVTTCQIKIDSGQFKVKPCSLNDQQSTKYMLKVQSVFNETQDPSNYTLKFNLTNAMFATSVQLSSEVVDGFGNIIQYEDNQVIEVLYQAKNMTQCSINLNSQIVGDYTSATISFVPQITIFQNSVVKIYFPIWFIWSVNQESCLDHPLLKCVGTTPNVQSTLTWQKDYNIATQQNYLVIKDAFNGGNISNYSSPVNFTIANFRNPFSPAPYGPIIIEVSYQDNIMQQCTLSKITSVTTPNRFKYFTIDQISNVIGAQFSNQIISIKTSNPIQISTGKLRLEFNENMNIQLTSNTNQLVSQGAGYLYIKSFTGSNVNVASSQTINLLNLGITNLKYSSNNVTIRITSEDEVGANRYLIDQSTFTYVINPGSILNPSIDSSSLLINENNNKLTFKFTPINKLNQTHSLIQILFPTEVTISNGNKVCKGVSSNVLASLTCNATSQILTIYNPIFSTSYNGNTEIQLSVEGFINPGSTKPTDSFIIRTLYFLPSNLGSTIPDYLVDKSSSSEPLAALTCLPRDLVKAYISIQPEDLTVGNTTVYSFKLRSTSKILQQSKIRIIFPSGQITVPDSSLCSISNISTNSMESSVSLQISYPNVDVVFAFASAAKPAGTDISFSISNIKNPLSFKPSYFALQILTDMNYKIDVYQQQSAEVSVAMTKLANLSFIKIIPDTLQAGRITNYNFQISFQNPHQQGYLLLIYFPLQVGVFNFGSGSQQQPTCMAGTGLTNPLSCTFKSQQVGNNGQIVQLVLNFQGGQPVQTISFTVQNVTNYFKMDRRFFQIRSLTNDVGQDYFIEGREFGDQGTDVSYSSGVITTASLLLSPGFMTTGGNQLTLTFTPNNSIPLNLDPSLSSIEVKLPSELEIPSSFSPACSVVSGISASTYNFQCSYNQIKQSFIVINAGPLNQPIQISIPNINFLFTQSGLTSSATVTTYHNGSILDSISSGLRAQATCDINCKTCSLINSTECVTCFQSETAFKLFDSDLHKCLMQCISPKVPDSNNICVTCSSKCKTCVENPYKCTSCNNGTFLYNNDCVSNCANFPPAYYFYENTDNNTCTQCQDPCLDCSAQNVCITCNMQGKTPYFNGSYCFSDCLPVGYYIKVKVSDFQISCVPCSGSCKTCLNTTDTCLSCTNGFSFYQNRCLNPCPDTFYSLNQVCKPCDSSKCKNCQETDYNCTACSSSSFLYNNTCQTACPQMFYQDTSNNQCKNCVKPCQTCNSTNFCQSCDPNSNATFLYQNWCYDQCPQGTIKNQGVCQLCQTGCSSCYGLYTNCSNCVGGYYLNGNQCTQTCPEGFVPEYQSCVPCQSPCVKCKDLKTICTQCKSGQFLTSSGDCVLAIDCGVGYFGNNIASPPQCTACHIPCKTCTSLSQCKSCESGFFLYIEECVAQCPVNITVQVGLQCQSCQLECTICSGSVSNCQSCQVGYYHYGNACWQTCPNGTFLSIGQCLSCKSPCLTCGSGQSDCKSCEEGRFLLDSQCIELPCPQGLFADNSALSCKRCQAQCLTCTDNITCSACNTSSIFPYLYNSQCVQTCPLDQTIASSQGCLPCNSQCAGCTGTTDSCNKCHSGNYLLLNKCVTSCPPELIGNKISGLCESPILQDSSEIVYFPYLIGALLFWIVSGVSKLIAVDTELFTNLVATTAPFEVLAWLTFIGLMVEFDQEYGVGLDAAVGVFFLGFILYMATNVYFIYYFFRRVVREDEYFIEWRRSTIYNNISLKIVSVLSITLTFKFFRIIYGRLFHKKFFTANFHSNEKLFQPVNLFSIASFFASSIPIIIAAAIAAQKAKAFKNQLFYTAIETILLTLLMLIYVLGDTHKKENYFGNASPQIVEGQFNQPVLVNNEDLEGANKQPQQQSQTDKYELVQPNESSSIINPNTLSMDATNILERLALDLSINHTNVTKQQQQTQTDQTMLLPNEQTQQTLFTNTAGLLNELAATSNGVNQYVDEGVQTIQNPDLADLQGSPPNNKKKYKKQYSSEHGRNGKHSATGQYNRTFSKKEIILEQDDEGQGEEDISLSHHKRIKTDPDSDQDLSSQLPKRKLDPLQLKNSSGKKGNQSSGKKKDVAVAAAENNNEEIGSSQRAQAKRADAATFVDENMLDLPIQQQLTDKTVQKNNDQILRSRSIMPESTSQQKINTQKKFRKNNSMYEYIERQNSFLTGHECHHLLRVYDKDKLKSFNNSPSPTAAYMSARGLPHKFKNKKKHKQQKDKHNQGKQQQLQQQFLDDQQQVEPMPNNQLSQSKKSIQTSKLKISNSKNFATDGFQNQDLDRNNSSIQQEEYNGSPNQMIILQDQNSQIELAQANSKKKFSKKSMQTQLRQSQKDNLLGMEDDNTGQILNDNYNINPEEPDNNTDNNFNPTNIIDQEENQNSDQPNGKQLTKDHSRQPDAESLAEKKIQQQPDTNFGVGENEQQQQQPQQDQQQMQEENMSIADSVNSYVQDTPSNYNNLNQRYDNNSNYQNLDQVDQLRQIFNQPYKGKPLLQISGFSSKRSSMAHTMSPSNNNINQQSMQQQSPPSNHNRTNLSFYNQKKQKGSLGGLDQNPYSFGQSVPQQSRQLNTFYPQVSPNNSTNNQRSLKEIDERSLSPKVKRLSSIQLPPGVSLDMVQPGDAQTVQQQLEKQFMTTGHSSRKGSTLRPVVNNSQQQQQQKFSFDKDYEDLEENIRAAQQLDEQIAQAHLQQDQLFIKKRPGKTSNRKNISKSNRRPTKMEQQVGEIEKEGGNMVIRRNDTQYQSNSNLNNAGNNNNNNNNSQAKLRLPRVVRQSYGKDNKQTDLEQIYLQRLVPYITPKQSKIHLPPTSKKINTKISTNSNEKEEEVQNVSDLELDLNDPNF